MGATVGSLVRWATFLGCALLSPFANAQTPSGAWRYDFRPGDHFLYQYTLERQTTGAEFEIHTKTTFTTHVLVVGEQSGRLSVGFQRNRESAQLLQYREKGKDKLAQQLPDFLQRMAKRPSRFSEANEFSSAGQALDYWQAARESPSKLLLAVHEIEALPEKPVEVGDAWKGINILGFDFRFAATENLSGKTCDRVEGSAGKAHLRYWWCSEAGALGRIEFEGEYSLPGGAVVHEKLGFELVDKHRGEKAADWLASPDTQRGALDALLLSRWLPLSVDALIPGLESGDPEVQALALACIYQRGLDPPHGDLLTKMARDGSPQVKRIAARVLNASPQPPALSEKDCALPPSRRYAVQKLGTSMRVMQGAPFQGIPYMLHVPKDYRGDRPFPLLIYLSGGAGLAIDGVNTAEDVVAPTGYLVLYPHAVEMWWKAEITARFAALLKEVLQNLNVDTNRVYIAGFSNGGTGALYYATLWPQRFAAVVSLMGAGTCMAEVAAGVANLASLPVLFVHGDKDPIIPSSCSHDTHQELGKLSPSVAPELQILKHREHDITLQDDDGLTLPFLADKVRNPFPPKIAQRLVDVTYPRRYWVEVVEKGRGEAEISGQIKTDNTMELTTRNVKRLRLLLRPELFASPGPFRVVINRKAVFQGELKQDCKVFQESSDKFDDPLLGYGEAMDFDVGK
jgi:pimeloyl-ACP methyl ester carboxylesterase